MTKAFPDPASTAKEATSVIRGTISGTRHNQPGLCANGFARLATLAALDHFWIHFKKQHFSQRKRSWNSDPSKRTIRHCIEQLKRYDNFSERCSVNQIPSRLFKSVLPASRRKAGLDFPWLIYGRFTIGKGWRSLNTEEQSFDARVVKSSARWVEIGSGWQQTRFYRFLTSSRTFVSVLFIRPNMTSGCE